VRGKFQDFINLYGITPENLKEISSLSSIFDAKTKEKISKRTHEFVIKYLPESAKLLEDLGATNAFSGTIEKFIDYLLNPGEQLFTYVETVAKTHITGSEIPLKDFLKDYTEFINAILTEVEIPPEKLDAFKKFILMLIAILTFITDTYINTIKEKAEVDPITKLPSKSKLIFKTHETLKNFKTAVLLDIENFTEYNLYYGYNVGNSILATIASLLQLNFYGCYVTRLQNDEFFIATKLPIGEVKKKLYKIQKELEEHPLSIPTSFGLENIKIEFTGVLLNTKMDENLKFNDLMWVLYNSLKEINDKFIEKIHIITREEFLNRLDNKRIITDLLFSLNQKHIKLAVQKVVNIFTGETFFKEILARIIFPNGKTISPALFINFTANSTIEKKLDRLVIESLFQLIKEKAINDRVSINVSQIFLQDDFYWLLSQMDKYGIPNEQLIIELTERADILTTKALRKKLEELKKRGISVFIDDYGVKFSNYNLLKELQVDGIKIDGSIIESLQKNPLDELFVNSVIEFAKIKDVYIVAEYIETKEQLEKLKNLSDKNKFCLIYGQGYLWGKPELIN
jgi:EAL domain-containing protein (putative c-di-GMP-specific phosphodiesterase class I)/GGDEF domain-containing protein